MRSTRFDTSPSRDGFAERGRDIEFARRTGQDHPYDPRAQRCADCGELGERTGHMGCQYPLGERRDV